MIKQAIWVLALIGRHLCEAVLECYEPRPDMDDPLPDDCRLSWIGDCDADNAMPFVTHIAGGRSDERPSGDHPVTPRVFQP